MQNLSIGNLFTNLRGRAKSAVGAFIFAILLCGMGATSAFYLAPKQAISAYQTSQLPIMDADFVNAAAAGSSIVVTGRLKGELANPQVPNFIAYSKERWDVTIEQDEEGRDEPPEGSWKTVELFIPPLVLEINGAPVELLASDKDIMYGEKIREVFVDGNGSLQADYLDRTLRDGAFRYQGFYSDDLATVLGKKAASGGIVPEEMFAGDRVEFEAAQKERAAIYFYGGILLMICSPLALVMGLWGAISGKT